MSPTEPRLRVLSLGAGVQSSTVLLMSCIGELPKLDAAVFADTGWEPQAVYRHLEWLEGIAGEHGIPVHRVSVGNIKEDALRYQVAYKGPESGRQLQKGITEDGRTRWGSMPYFILNPDGSKGMIKRQCTSEYKIVPIERFIKRTLLGTKKYARIPKDTVELWMGISTDEMRRLRMSREPWKKHWFPLIDTGMSRTTCYKWMDEHGYPEPPRSSCLGCPFHSDAEWRNIKQNSDEWAGVVAFDRAIRKCGGMRGDVFLHSSRRPIEDVDFRNDIDRGQMSLFDNECLGICGV